MRTATAKDKLCSTTVKGQKTGHVPFSDVMMLDPASFKPARVNGVLYNPIDPNSARIKKMAAGIKETIAKYGVESIDAMVVTTDDTILSGHSRQVVYALLGVSRAPVKRVQMASTDLDFERQLVRYNDQRQKDPAELVREQIALSDPEDVYLAVQRYRARESQVRTTPLVLGDRRPRNRLSKARNPLLAAIDGVLKELENYWPLTDRRIHYALLNDPPLIHASKPDSRYENDKASYKVITSVLTCARLEGRVPWEAIGDETRPVTTWAVHPNVAPFVQEQFEEFLTGYNRDLMIGQPNHIEIVGEKMTVEGTVRPIAARYCIPYTIGRGYSSLPPRKDMFDRFKASGKSRLVILFMSDHDPEGEDIPDSYSLSMRDDFGLKSDEIVAVKVGLNAEQVRQLKLPPNTEAKTKSSRYAKFAKKYGTHAYELEAVRPDLLRQWLNDAILKVIDAKQFNAQIELDKADSVTLVAYRKTALAYLKEMTGALEPGLVPVPPHAARPGDDSEGGSA